ncbi:hypothetical protein EW146_g9098 [Bondarzewia mesenterica]|uniref:C2H2-type domain-containing protein n=1 Tax=Bondarzewia mesenterica TaxID=1095465 RepID=A0A4S4L9A6_9AGAM|nr:hypothetical protein EW146_g9098 [Bondarzewia mesenterica]
MSQNHPRCTRCPTLGFASTEAFQQHVATQHPEFRCRVCDQVFGSDHLLEEHYRDSFRHPTCPECRISFVDDRALAEHVLAVFNPLLRDSTQLVLKSELIEEATDQLPSPMTPFSHHTAGPSSGTSQTQSSPRSTPTAHSCAEINDLMEGLFAPRTPEAVPRNNLPDSLPALQAVDSLRPALSVATHSQRSIHSPPDISKTQELQTIDNAANDDSSRKQPQESLEVLLAPQAPSFVRSLTSVSAHSLQSAARSAQDENFAMLRPRSYPDTPRGAYSAVSPVAQSIAERFKIPPVKYPLQSPVVEHSIFPILDRIINPGTASLDAGSDLRASLGLEIGRPNPVPPPVTVPPVDRFFSSPRSTVGNAVPQSKSFLKGQHSDDRTKVASSLKHRIDWEKCDVVI